MRQNIRTYSLTFLLGIATLFIASATAAQIQYESSAPRGEDARAYSGAAQVSEDLVILIPSNSPKVGLYDTSTGTLEHGASHGQGSFAFAGGVQVSEDLVVFAPRNSDNVGLYNPVTDTYENGTAHPQGNNAFHGAEVLSDGTVVFVPFSSDRVYTYDAQQDSLTQGPLHGENTGTTGAFRGSTVLDDDRVVFAPFESDNIGVYEDATSTYTSGPAHNEGDHPFSDAALMDDNRVIFSPWNTDKIMVYDVDSEELTETSTHTHGADDSAFLGAVRLFDERTVLVPYNSDVVGIVDGDGVYQDGPEHNERVSEDQTGMFWWGERLDDGRVLFAAWDSNNTGLLTGTPGPPGPSGPEPVDFAQGVQDAAAGWGFRTNESQMFFALAVMGIATVATGTGLKVMSSGRTKNLILAGVGFLVGVFFVLVRMLEFWMFTVAAILAGFALLGGPREVANTWAEATQAARRVTQDEADVLEDEEPPPPPGGPGPAPEFRRETVEFLESIPGAPERPKIREAEDGFDLSPRI